jgi:hypothetical protein
VCASFVDARFEKIDAVDSVSDLRKRDRQITSSASNIEDSDLSWLSASKVTLHGLQNKAQLTASA